MRTKRTVAVAVAALGAALALARTGPAPATSAALAAPAVPVPAAPAAVQDACQPDPLEPGLQILRCRYGPLEVTPAANLILAGPVTIESPRADGYVVGFRPDMVDAVSGAIPPIHEVHLHHGVWLSARPRLNPGQTFDEVRIPFAATGEEKTVLQLPPGYGYRVGAADEWVLNFMIHNLTASNRLVTITYEVAWYNASSPQAPAKDVVPVWLDTVGGLYPVYDPVDSASIVTDTTLGQVHRRDVTFTLDQDTVALPPGADALELVWAAGHVHPGGHRIDVEVDRCGSDETDRLAFTSEARLNERNPAPPGAAFGSWDFLMTGTDPSWRLTLHRGDRIRTRTYYDVDHPWYEAMGIVFAWAHPIEDAAAAAGCPQQGPTTGGPTREIPPDVPIFGGTTPLYADPSTRPASSTTPVTRIDIVGYDYRPGGLAQAPAPVAAGSSVRFVNVDAAGSIFHTVTPCSDPACNRDTGQSYPLAAWDFFPGRGSSRDAFPDSRQLGYGPPGATSAANRYDWTLTVPSDAQVGDTFTFFCRVHPYMRGSIKVV